MSGVTVPQMSSVWIPLTYSYFTFTCVFLGTVHCKVSPLWFLPLRRRTSFTRLGKQVNKLIINNSWTIYMWYVLRSTTPLFSLIFSVLGKGSKIRPRTHPQPVCHSFNHLIQYTILLRFTILPPVSSLPSPTPDVKVKFTTPYQSMDSLLKRFHHHTLDPVKDRRLSGRASDLN